MVLNTKHPERLIIKKNKSTDRLLHSHVAASLQNLASIHLWAIHCKIRKYSLKPFGFLYFSAEPAITHLLIKLSIVF